MIKFLNVLRFLCVSFVYLFLLDWIKINSWDVEILYISGYMFRFVFVWTLLYYLLYCLFEVFVPYLYNKISDFMFRLFPNGNKNV